MSMIDFLAEFEDEPEMLDALESIGWTGTDDQGQRAIQPPSGCGYLETALIVTRAVIDEEGATITPEVLFESEKVWYGFCCPADNSEQIEALWSLSGMLVAKPRGVNVIQRLKGTTLDLIRGCAGIKRFWAASTIDLPTITYEPEI